MTECQGLEKFEKLTDEELMNVTGGNCAEKIKSVRQNLGLTQEDVARKIFVDTTTLASWEHGRSIPSSENLFYLSQVFHTSMEELLDMPGDK